MVDNSQRALGSSGPSVFNLPPSINVPFVSAVLIGLICLTILFDTVLHHLHVSLSNAKRQMLEKLKDELMVLGFLSFLITLLEQSGVHIPMEEHILFEFAHMLVFFVAMALILYSARLMRIESKISRKWDVLDTSQIFVDGSSKDAVSSETLMSTKEGLNPLLVALGIKGIINEGTEYHIAKALFFDHHDLNKVFDFPEYLHHNLVHNITNILEVSKTAWLTIIALVVLNLIRYLVFHAIEFSFGSSTLLFELSGVSLVFLDLTLLFIGQRTKVRFIATMKLRTSEPHVSNGLEMAKMLWSRRGQGRSLTTLVSAPRQTKPKGKTRIPEKDVNTGQTVTDGQDGSTKYNVFRKLSIDQFQGNRKRKKARVHVVALEASVPQNENHKVKDVPSEAHYQKSLRKTFPFGKPEWYHNAVTTMVVLYSFYAALLAMYFMNLLLKQLDAEAISIAQCIFEVVVMLMPLLIHFLFVNERVISTWTFLDALVLSNPNIFDEVVQNTLDTNIAYAQLRGQFMVHYEFETSLSIIDDHEKIRGIFKDFDKDGTGYLNTVMFAKICQECSTVKLHQSTILALLRLIQRDERMRKMEHLTSLKELQRSLLHQIYGYHGNLFRRYQGYFCKQNKRDSKLSFSSFQRFFVGLETVRTMEKSQWQGDSEQQREASYSHDASTQESLDSNVAHSPEKDHEPTGSSAANLNRAAAVSGIEKRRNSNNKSLEKLSPYRKKAHMFAFRTKDPATFDKSWGKSYAKGSDFVMVSTEEDANGGRDMYCISANEFACNYEPVGGSVHEVRKRGVVFAQLMANTFEVAVRRAITETGEEGGTVVVLSGQAGDFIVRPVGNEPYIVTQQKFFELYEPVEKANETQTLDREEALPVHKMRSEKLPPIQREHGF